MPEFIDVPMPVRQEIDSILHDIERVRRALQAPAVLPHVHKGAKAALRRAARASYALARSL